MANYGPGPVTMDFHIINTHLTEPLFLVGSSALTMTNATGAFSILTSPTSPVPPGGANFVDFAIQVVYLGHTKTYQETVTLKTSDAANQTFTFTVSSLRMLRTLQSKGLAKPRPDRFSSTATSRNFGQ